MPIPFDEAFRIIGSPNNQPELRREGYWKYAVELAKFREHKALIGQYLLRVEKQLEKLGINAYELRKQNREKETSDASEAVDKSVRDAVPKRFVPRIPGGDQ